MGLCEVSLNQTAQMSDEVGGCFDRLFICTVIVPGLHAHMLFRAIQPGTQFASVLFIHHEWSYQNVMKV